MGAPTTTPSRSCSPRPPPISFQGAALSRYKIGIIKYLKQPPIICFQDFFDPAMLWFFDCGVVKKAIDDALRAAINVPQPKIREFEPLNLNQLFTAMAIWVIGMALCILIFCVEKCTSKYGFFFHFLLMHFMRTEKLT